MKLPNVARLAAVQKQERELEIQVPGQLPWPELPEKAFHGVVGSYVRKLAPHTEADPVGILLQILLMAGNVIGRGPHFCVEADRHYFNLFAVLVGDSSKGRKGVSANQARRLFEAVDEEWCAAGIQHGLASGEGLIWAVRDPVEKTEAERNDHGPTGKMTTVVVDEGVSDKRLLVFESEFASTLRVAQRPGNTLSPTIREAWDRGDLRTLTKNSPARATDAHISIIGHVTRQELLRYLTMTEKANGFGNRFLWCCVRRSNVLPEGGRSHEVDFGLEIRGLVEAIEAARQTGEVRRDDEAKEIWAQVYPALSAAKPGLLGSVISRAEAQTMRLACLYALLDRSAIVRAEHLLAALALWEYCERSAHWIFGDALGDPVADEILSNLRNSPEGLTKTEISQLFGRHRKKDELGRALCELQRAGLATAEKEEGVGRSAERWKAVAGKRVDP